MVGFRNARADAFPDDAQVTSMLQDRIDKVKRGVGIVVGLVDARGTKIISYGKFAQGNPKPVDGDTIFEIGSASKVFTSLLLADMVERGIVKLDDPISKYLPAAVKVPSRNGKQITLADLATHRSGLPRMPDNLTPADPSNPYADYTVTQMYEFISGYTLTRDIGSKYEYSNLGAGLLGHILALKSGMTYEALLRQRIGNPLGMTSTEITLTPALKTRLATGHNDAGRAVANWDIPTFAGAGAIRSTANDLLKFLSASIGLTPTPLAAAMKLQQKPLHDAGSPGVEIGLGWHITKKFGTELIWHNGETGGYHSFMGFDPNTKRGVVVLANSAGSIDDIGYHLLESKYELAHFEPRKTRTPIKLDAKILKDYVGQYELAPGAIFNVRVEGDHLAAQLTGQGYADIFAASEREFYYELVDAQISFVKDTTGKTTSLILHQNGANQPAKKISDEVPKELVAAKVDPKMYDTYAGKYQLAPGAQFTVRREAGKLMVQLTGQPFFEVFPKSETEFFYKVVDARITFVKNAKGEVTELILDQNGIEQRAKRIK